MGCWQCLPLSVVQLKGKHCRNGVVDTFGLRCQLASSHVKCGINSNFMFFDTYQMQGLFQEMNVIQNVIQNVR